MKRKATSFSTEYKSRPPAIQLHVGQLGLTGPPGAQSEHDQLSDLEQAQVARVEPNTASETEGGQFDDRKYSTRVAVLPRNSQLIKPLVLAACPNKQALNVSQ